MRLKLSNETIEHATRILTEMLKKEDDNMYINKLSPSLEDLEEELKANGFEKMPDNVIPTITKSRVYVSVEGKVATILKRKRNYSLVYRDIKPIYKGAGKTEYRVSIDGRTHALHKLVAITYPSFCGKWSPELDIHHIDCNHLNCQAENLICITKELHKKVHYILEVAAYREAQLKVYLDEHITYNNEVSEERLEEIIHG